jgi:tetratricopeptide (TPR) repeat protein
MVAGQAQDDANAIYWFDRVLKVNPNFGPAHLQRAKVLLARGQPDLAMASLDRACKLMPNDFEAHYNLGVLLSSTGNEKDALRYLERALELRPNGPLAQKLKDEIARLKAK